MKKAIHIELIIDREIEKHLMQNMIIEMFPILKTVQYGPFY